HIGSRLGKRQHLVVEEAAQAAPSGGGGGIGDTSHASGRGGTTVSGAMGRLMQALCFICVFGDLIIVPEAYFWPEKEKKENKKKEK
ncbi:hypothetical protein Goshw_026408, partial [Gossypium schwendimanii]|nr:hypothetical protein [Gossypium schwendimanii]